MLIADLRIVAAVSGVYDALVGVLMRAGRPLLSQIFSVPLPVPPIHADLNGLFLFAVAAGYGIANERKWAYYLGIALAALPLVGDLLLCIDNHVSPLKLDLITLIFQIGMFVLLIHPQSRDYQRVWFK